jgi:hypothetical protein
MAVVKRSVALDADVDARIVALAGPGSVSRLVNEALRFYLQRIAVEAVEEELAREHGPISPEVQARAEEILGPR